MAWYIWLIMAGVFLIFEILTVGFLIFWLSIAALITMVVSFFIDSIIVQTAVFVIASTILIFATKPFVKKITENNNVKTNVYSTIGKIGIVTKEINNIEGVGQIKVDGEIWSAYSATDSPIAKGTEVKIVNIDGVKLIVAPKN